ncbi:MAG TPA: 3-hydroxyacyl-CoA dehydrogenase NAD-binding domain-containing protein [Piscinibacter sp.]|nr:3-hydroxyacyl-CoA dehydrogenase NAD-binding domain-containing protein [Piscinibacter sp.]
MSIRHVAVVGLGVIGAGWVAQFLGAGLQVRCFDPSAEATAALEPFLARALGDASAWQSRLCVAQDLQDAMHGVDLVQENGPEALPLKRALIEAIDAAAAPSTLIASSTSGHRPSDLQAMARAHPQRILVAHPLNPPHLIPLLEVVPGQRTSATDLSRAVAFYESLGKKVIVPRHERVGHAANRLQAALLREAFALAIDGTLDVPDIDAILTHGLALRWAAAGPFALTELGGGAAGSRAMLERLGPALNGWWGDLSRLELDESARETLLEAMARHPSTPCSAHEMHRLVQHTLRYQAFWTGTAPDP